MFSRGVVFIFLTNEIGNIMFGIHKYSSHTLFLYIIFSVYFQRKVENLNCLFNYLLHIPFSYRNHFEFLRNSQIEILL